MEKKGCSCALLARPYCCCSWLVDWNEATRRRNVQKDDAGGGCNDDDDDRERERGEKEGRRRTHDAFM